MASTSEFSFHGNDFVVLPDGGLYWPARRALLLADLHLEKGSWFARTGQMLPPYDSDATLGVIERMIGLVDPAEIWCLGDSFHDEEGPGRLDALARERLDRMARGRVWTWVVGNHDAIPQALYVGDIVPEARVDGVILRHESGQQESEPEISGHFHPKWSVRSRGRSISRRCFVMGGNRLILPAAGAFTGGLNVRHQAISGLFTNEAQVLVPIDGGLLRFALPVRRSVGDDNRCKPATVGSSLRQYGDCQ